ncbi:hypothetical protein CPT_Mater84 [Bacillus phage Mater]|uniref:Uncharacterized protein n=1 Tax=Bacillus phage Mater TaxID=1540090 RepID=A0A0A0RRY3_9CAUD|nr:hypothetical protein CPT_Mater84 [Bacillus phage Mater]AIW03241.1 hypothetical protein CPT_Mater84 [Bacillus phage Mater]
MTKAVKFKQLNDEAVVKEVEGVVQVERGGSVTPFRPQYKFEDIVSQFEANGWEKVEEAVNAHTPGTVTTIAAASGGMGEVSQQVAQSAMQQDITLSLQQNVDDYLELHDQMAALKKKADALKKNIRTYMDANDVKALKGSNGKEVYLQEAKASNSTSRYTDYELQDVMSTLEGTLLKKVTEIRINAEKLDALLKVEKLPKEVVEVVKSKKICNEGTPRFSVRK